MSLARGPVQRSAPAAQHEHHGESSTAASALFVHSLVIVITAVAMEMAVTRRQHVAFIANTLKENIPLLMLNTVSAPHSTLSSLQSSDQALLSISFIIPYFRPSVIW